MSVAIRRARRRDANVLARLLRGYFRSIEREVGPQDANETAAFYACPPGAAWIAMIDGKPAACACLRKLRSRSCELKHLYVASPYRGSGLGRRLLRFVHRHARRAGYRAVFLDTLRSMNAAQSLYAHEGYVPCAAYYRDPVSRIFMRKRL